MYNTNERGVRHPNAQPAQQPMGHAAGQPGLTYGQSAASGPAPTTAGHHRHDLLNKLDPRVDSTHDHQPAAAAQGGVPEGTYGPHRSRLANALDPRVDSDLDSTRAGGGMGAGGGGYWGGQQQPATAAGAAAASHHAAPGMHGGAGYGSTGAGAGGGVPEGTYGPHSSRLTNALDPRVDSDRDRGRYNNSNFAPGGAHATGGGIGGASGARPAGGPAGAAPGPGGLSGSGSHTAGPHRSDLLNKLDPRVDSKTGAWKGGSGTRGTY